MASTATPPQAKSWTSKHTSSFIPSEYMFPDEEIGNGKTFIYVDSSNSEEHSQDHYFGYNNGQKCRIVRAYSSTGTNDSTIYINHKLVESYSRFFYRDELTRAAILQDTIVQNGKRLGKNILIVKFESESRLLTIRTQSEFLKDTIFNWKGRMLPTIAIQTTYNSTMHWKSEKEVDTSFKIEIITYEAKRTGTVRIRVLTTKENRPKNLDLIAVQNRHI